VDQAIANCHEGIRRGVVLPRVIVRKVIPQIRSHLGPVKESEFLKPIRQFPDGMDKQTRAELTAELRKAVQDSVIAAYRKLLTFVENEYVPACRDTVGIWAIPDGDAIYDNLARFHTTTELSVDEIHSIGLREIERIHQAMAAVAKEMGFDGSVEQFIDYMRTAPKFKAASREALLDGFRSILKRTTAQMPRLFNRLPRARCEVKEIEAYRAASAAAAYAYPPPADGSRPGYFYVNTYQATHRPTYTMEALTYHEAYPGHHLQLSLDIENASLPAFRRHGEFTAYVEGWGLYAEGLGSLIGGYRDPPSRFGRLTYDAWRAARLVVDTGIHRYHWSRQKAINYMKANTGLSEVNIESEVDRYIAWPGQALAYKIGELTIRRIRIEAERRLGERFDLRRFHDALLCCGAQPLSILETRMRAWVDAQIAPPGS